MAANSPAASAGTYRSSRWREHLDTVLPKLTLVPTGAAGTAAVLGALGFAVRTEE